MELIFEIESKLLVNFPFFSLIESLSDKLSVWFRFIEFETDGKFSWWILVGDNFNESFAFDRRSVSFVASLRDKLSEWVSFIEFKTDGKLSLSILVGVNFNESLAFDRRDLSFIESLIYKL